MKKRMLIVFFALLLIMAVGCGNEDPKDINNNQNTDNTEEIEEVETYKITRSVKREDLGEFTSIKKVENKNFSDENEQIKITITDYSLYQLKPKEEYEDIFSDRIAVLDIYFDFKNLSSEMLELEILEGVLTTNTGEKTYVFLSFEVNGENGFKLFGNEVKKGSTSAILNSKAEDIESFKFTYDESIVIELDFQ